MEHSKEHFETSAADSRLHRYFGRERQDDPVFLAEQREPEYQALVEAREQQKINDIREALALLDADQRKIVHLIVQEGKTRREVALLLSLPKSTVDDKYRKSLANLAECLDAYRHEL